MIDERASVIFGSMNSMYFLQGTKNIQNRFIRLTNIQKDSQYISDENFNTQIQVSSFFAWGLLFISVIFSAFIPCWLMGDVKSQSLTRNSWRYFTVSILLLPFLIYEQRNVKNQKQKFFNLLTQQNLQPIFVSTINFCVWLICLIYACKFTSMNHAVCLTALKVFFSSILKIRRGEHFHQFQIGGNMLCALGVFLVLTDSITLPQIFEDSAQKYMRTEPWKRLILGDGLSIIGSIVSVYLDQNISVPEMPKFSYLFLYNIFLCFNLITSGYFFGGSQFSFNTKFGIFGLFTYSNFVSVFYVSIMLGLNLMLVNILIGQIFNNVVISVASCFEIIVTSMTYHILRQELIPSGLTCLGYSFLIPGLILIIGGQGALSNSQNKFNFELYRPTQIRPTQKYDSRVLFRSKSIKSNQNFSGNDSPNKLKPFQMILKQEQKF